MRRNSLGFCVVYIALGSVASCVRGVELNGIPIQNANSTFEITREVTEFREGGAPGIRLIPGLKRYTACVVADAPIAVLDAELPVIDTPSPFTVKVEDGREFSNCLVHSLKTGEVEKNRGFTYCLRCEDVTMP
jgi:hypothetical protein